MASTKQHKKKQKQKIKQLQTQQNVSVTTDKIKNDTPSKVKIFDIYFKPNMIFESKVFQPMLTSSIDWAPGNIIRDNTGINIADRSKHYGELSGHYWIWKNYLPDAKEDYIGFCHYRRFLDFGITKMPDVPFKPVFANEFKYTFKKYTEENILKCIDGYDIILPHKFYFQDPICEQYARYHPKEGLISALNILEEMYPEYADAARDFMNSYELFICLNFIMKKDLLNEYLEWMFNILLELERRSDWSKYVEYLEIRLPAYIAERFFNIWLNHNVKKRNLKILKTSSVYLMGKDYSDVNPNVYRLRYDVFTQMLNNRIAQLVAQGAQIP